MMNSVNVSILAKKIGWSIQFAFGNMFLAGAVLIVVIAVALYKSGVPMDASIAISVPLMIALTGLFLPSWVGPIVVVGIATFAGLAFYKLFMSQ
jgi:hypothetical protein